MEYIIKNTYVEWYFVPLDDPFWLSMAKTYDELHTKIFSGDQPCQCWNKKRFVDLLRLHHQGCCAEWTSVADMVNIYIYIYIYRRRMVIHPIETDDGGKEDFLDAGS
jgi:hypothetical protein